MAHMTFRLGTVVESVLRVPPLFVLDEIFKSGFTFPFNLSGWNDEFALSANQTIGSDAADFGALFYASILFPSIKFSVSLISCLLTLLVAVLNIRELILVYFYLISVSMLYFSYHSNVAFVDYALASETQLRAGDAGGAALYSTAAALVLVATAQYIIGFLYQYLNPTVLSRRGLSQTVRISFWTPAVLCFLPLPEWMLRNLPFYAVLLPLLVSKYVFWSNVPAMTRYLTRRWRFCRNFVMGFGLPALIEAGWSILHVPVVLRLFWIIRLLDHTATYIMENNLSKNITIATGFDEAIWLSSYRGEVILVLQEFMQLVKSLLVTGCETFIAVLGMTSLISYGCQQIGHFFQYVLLMEDEEKNFGSISGILFCILALQTGLTGLKPEKRFVKLCRNVCLLFTALLHIMHSMLNPLLMSLSASHNPALRRHARALIVSGFLIIYPVSLLIFLWRCDSISTWLLAVSAFSVEVIVKMAVSLIVYFLFLVDYYRKTFWEELDDYVYYIRSFGNTVEFCFGIFLFFNGSWILYYESGGAIRAMMMCIHAYFNIWCEAIAGWSVFMKRRTAVQKIDKLSNAKISELQDLNDVCSICYQQMKTAKVTTCKHYFHAVCLRKWLYLQDYCPICHSILHSQEVTPNRQNQVAAMGSNRI